MQWVTPPPMSEAQPLRAPILLRNLRSLRRRSRSAESGCRNRLPSRAMRSAARCRSPVSTSRLAWAGLPLAIGITPRAAGRVGNGGNVEGYHAGTGATASLSARGSAVQPDFSQLETFAAAKRALFVVLAHFRECKQTLLGRLYIASYLARDDALGQLAADELRSTSRLGWSPESISQCPPFSCLARVHAIRWH
jgi:hypothetical protein